MADNRLDRAAALRVAADELAACQTCGKRHTLHPDELNDRLVSWADLGDGHSYRPHDLSAADWLEDRAAGLDGDGRG